MSLYISSAVDTSWIWTIAILDSATVWKRNRRHASGPYEHTRNEQIKQQQHTETMKTDDESRKSCYDKKCNKVWPHSQRIRELEEKLTLDKTFLSWFQSGGQMRKTTKENESFAFSLIWNALGPIRIAAGRIIYTIFL